MGCLPEAKSAAVIKWETYFRDHPNEKMVIIHLNRNALDFNIENLMWGPKKLPHCLFKLTAQKVGNKFWAEFQVDGEKCCSNRMLTPEDALHHADILKMTSPYMPSEFLATVFSYGLNRPAGFEQYYDSMETLMERATLPHYQKRFRKEAAKRPSMAQFAVFNSTQAFLQDDRAPAELCDTILGEKTLGRPRCEPFSEEQDCIVLYTGARGKKIAFLLERKDLDILQDRSLGRNPAGAVEVIDGAKRRFLRQLILGYEEGKQVSHGPGKVLDNRRRTLSHATRSIIFSNRGNPTSKSFGVFWDTNRRKWRVNMRIFEGKDQVYLGRFSEEADAAAASDFATANKAELRLRAAGMTKKIRDDYVRRCCREKKILDLVQEGTSPCHLL
jgi:hypothetical protein